MENNFALDFGDDFYPRLQPQVKSYYETVVDSPLLPNRWDFWEKYFPSPHSIHMA